MYGGNLGSEGFWNCLFILAGIGIIASIVGAIAGIVWLFNHVHIHIQ